MNGNGALLEGRRTAIVDRPVSLVEPLAVRARISRRQPKGLPVINMSFNELPFAPSKEVAAAIGAASAQANRYGNPTCAALRNGLAERFGLDADSIICGNGSEELLDVIARCFVSPGDEIVIPEFGYIQFPIIANRLGAKLVKVPEVDFTADVDALLAAITPKTRLLFLANPNNPTGSMISENELARFARELPRDVVLVIDLAYGEFAGFDYCASVHDLVRQHENLVVTRTFSKAYGLAGLRAGWCQAPDWMLPVLYAARGMGSVNAVAQAAALAALQEPELVEERVRLIVTERERVAAALSELDFLTLPSHTNFLLAGCPEDDPERAEALADHLFDDVGILVNRTREKGLERYIRFSLSLPEHNDLLLQSAESFLEA